jgi:hypothetical protein
VRKLAVLLGALLALGGGLGARALATHATVTADPGPPPCVNVSGQVDGTPVNVDQTQCAPSGAPGLPSLPPPTIPNLPSTPPPTVPNLPSLPSPSLPNLPGPSLPNLPGPTAPNLPSLTNVQSASVADAAGGLCNYDSVRPSPPPASEQAVTLPDGTTIYRNFSVDQSTMTASGYMGGTNPTVGTLEGGGTASPAGVTGQIDGNSVQSGLSGYLGTNGACLGK